MVMTFGIITHATQRHGQCGVSNMEQDMFNGMMLLLTPLSMNE